MWKKAVFGTVSASFVGYVVWVSCLSPTRHEIEWDVATRVTAVLERTGFSEVVPVVDGRDVELRGQVSSVSEAQRAERMVRMVRGVRVVRTSMFVVEDEDLGGGDT
ncbi:MAG: BON domain-containing protein [Polyangiales bacterium]